MEDEEKVKAMGFKEYVRENLFLLGCLSIFIGVMIFFSLNTRYMKANAASLVWLGATIFICLGLILLAIDRYLNR